MRVYTNIQKETKKTKFFMGAFLLRKHSGRAGGGVIKTL
jgi:hypothetical protein